MRGIKRLFHPFLRTHSKHICRLYIIIGMSELAKERPPNPVEWLASYLIQHDPQRVGAGSAPNMPR